MLGLRAMFLVHILLGTSNRELATGTRKGSLGLGKCVFAGLSLVGIISTEILSASQFGGCFSQIDLAAPLLARGGQAQG